MRADAGPYAFDHGPGVLRGRVGQAVGHDVDQHAQGGVGGIGGGVDASVGFEQAEPPVALAFAGADVEIAERVLALQLGQAVAPVRGQRIGVAASVDRQPLGEQRVVAVYDEIGGGLRQLREGPAMSLGKTQISHASRCGARDGHAAAVIAFSCGTARPPACRAIRGDGKRDLGVAGKNACQVDIADARPGHKRAGDVVADEQDAAGHG